VKLPCTVPFAVAAHLYPTRQAPALAFAARQLSFVKQCGNATRGRKSFDMTQRQKVGDCLHHRDASSCVPSCHTYAQVLNRLGFLSGGRIRRSHIIIAKGGRVVDVRFGVSPYHSVTSAVNFCRTHAVPVGATTATAAAAVARPTAAAAAAATPAGGSSQPAQQPQTRMPKLAGKVTRT
jgi:hypothetical protein